FEDSIYKLLKKELSEYSNIIIKYGKNVDFIIEYNGKRLAVECKSSLNHLNNKQINEYFNDEKNINNLIVVSESDIKENMKDDLICKYSNLGKNFRIIDNFNKEVEKKLILEIKNILI
ncbi:hypothetical protein ACG59Z_16530, partial [Acinetobacter sp. ABJ_C1_1]